MKTDETGRERRNKLNGNHVCITKFSGEKNLYAVPDGKHGIRLGKIIGCTNK
ncbi:MAG TPA: hypothetical protein VI731_04785 [Bacteroidia bacterium]|nr:hypothetical protein [Bacteroidia bacterium]